MASRTGPVHCPYCGAVRDATGERPAAATGERPPTSAGEVLEGLYEQVELIRKMAEKSSQQASEIRLLRETIARLRGAGAHEVPSSPGQHAVPPRAASAPPRETSAAR